MSKEDGNYNNQETNTQAKQMHAHIDCFSGVAGDMLLGALVDAAPNSEELLKEIENRLKMGIPEISKEFSLSMERVTRGQLGSIAACKVHVKSIYGDEIVMAKKEREVVSGHSHEHSHGHAHSHSHEHSHNHVHKVKSTSTAQPKSPFRNLPDITHLITNASSTYIPPSVKSLSLSTFRLLAVAEAQTHGFSSPDDVHFHEVGAVDSIVDTIGTVLGFHLLNVHSFSCSAIPVSGGYVHNTAHGSLPIPAPATLRLMVDMKLCPGPRHVTGELVTPTGMALLKALVTPNQCGNGIPDNMTLKQIGLGAGTKDFYHHPNIVRVLIGTTTDHNATDLPQQPSWNKHTLTHLQCTIDDMNPEILPHVLQKLLQEGAIDAYITPIIVKKGRPAYVLNTLFHQNKNDTIIQTKILSIIFKETTTIGIRIYKDIQRVALQRSTVPVVVTFNDDKVTANVKISTLDGEIVSVKPEFDDCQKIALEKNIPLKVVMEHVLRQGWKKDIEN